MPAVAIPFAGLTFADLSLAALEAGGNRVRAARRLGIGVRTLDRHVALLDLDRWFISGRGRGRRPRSKCVTAEQIRELCSEGYTRKDSAYLLGISYGYLKDLLHQYRLDNLAWVNGRSVAQKGYCR